jgi:hypothetical protein
MEKDVHTRKSFCFEEMPSHISEVERKDGRFRVDVYEAPWNGATPPFGLHWFSSKFDALDFEYQCRRAGKIPVFTAL